MKIISLNEYKKLYNLKNNLFISEKWLLVLEMTYGIKFLIVNEDDFNLPFCITKDKYIKSIPFGDYTLINHNQDLLSKALQYLTQNYPESYIETTAVEGSKSTINNFECNKTGYLVRININDWKKSLNWKSAYERNIKNAINYGLSVHIRQTFDGVNDFYLLHEQLRINKFHKLPQPRSFFENIFKVFIAKNNGFFLEAWLKDKLLASWMILEYNDILYYKFGASDLNNLHLRPNDLLFRSLMQLASDKQIREIDLGFSGASKSYEGLLKFKKKEGGISLPIYNYEYYPNDETRNAIKQKANHLSEIISRAIGSGNLDFIRQTSEKYYPEFI